MDTHLDKEEAYDVEVAQWYWKANADPFSDEPPQWQAYSEYQNMQIETAFQEKDDAADIGNYVVKFGTMFQYSKADSYKMRKVKREISRVRNIKRIQEKMMNEPVSDPSEVLGIFGNTYQHFMDLTKIRCGFQYYDFPILGAVKEIRELGKKLKKKSDLKDMKQELEKIEKICNENENCSIKDVKDHVLRLYTMDTFLYSELNRYLRDEEWDSLREIYSYFYLLMDCLNYYVCKPLSKPLTVYRGVPLTKKQLDLYNDSKSSLFSWNSFTSTSMDQSIANNFGVFADKIVAIFVITLRNKIYDLSETSVYTGEQEILLPAGTILKYIKKVKKEGKCYIYLETAQQEDMKEKKTDIKYIEEAIKSLRQQKNPIIVIHSIVDAATLNANKELCQAVFKMLEGVECHCLSIEDANDRVISELANLLLTINIKALYIKGCTINESLDILVSAIRRSGVASLSLSNNISNSLNSKIPDMIVFSSIRNLMIHSKQMDDDAAIEILRALTESSIATLSLSSSDLISDKTGKYALSKLEKYSIDSIDSIWFNDTNVSADIIKKINEKCNNHRKTRKWILRMEINESDYMNSKFVNPGSKRIDYNGGDIYIGDIKDDERHGSGILFHHSGDRYEGGWKHSRMHGVGIYYSHNGNKYEGQWRENKKHGRGKNFWPNGTKYEGQLKNDEMHGTGTMFCADGNKYEGEWSEGHKHGKGVYYYANGDIFIGESKNDMKHGKGVYYGADGDEYEGEWRNDNCHGKGIFSDGNGDKYEIVYEDEKIISQKKI